MSAAQVLYPSAVYPQVLLPHVLPMLWAVGAELPILDPPAGQPLRSVPANMAVYRKYTEAILRRYIRMAMEAGKVPSLLGQEMFRGKVTSYRVGNFDDAVIFVSDVERCLHQLEPQHQELITRIALQEYTILETARILGLHPSSIVRRYALALDLLTRVFLDVRMLEPMESCQEEEM
jgi:hypothetical protein